MEDDVLPERTYQDKLKEKTEKLKWLNEFQGYKTKATHLIKELESLHQSAKLQEYLGESNAIRSSDEKSLKNEKKDIFKFLQLNKERITKLRLLVQQQSKEHKPINVERIKTLMEQIENEIISFKAAQREKYEILAADEKMLEKEIMQFNNQFDLWKEQQNSNASEPVAEIPKPRSKPSLGAASKPNVPPEFVELETFLDQNGGTTGGWEEPDHAHFLRLRTKLKANKELFYTTAAREIPNQTIYTVQQHEDFYIKYTELAQKKKEAIAKWKEERQKQMEKALLAPQMDEKKLKEIEMNERMRREQEEQEKEEKRKRVQEWKMLKDLEQQREQMEKQRQAEEKKKKEEEEKKRRLDLKNVVEQFRLQKPRHPTPREKEMSDIATTPKRPPSRQDLEKLQMKDQEMLNRQLYLKTKKIREQQQKEEKKAAILSNVHIDVDRDFQRVLKPTAAHSSRITERVLNGADTDAANTNFNIRRVQHRIVPSWRKGV